MNILFPARCLGCQTYLPAEALAKAGQSVLCDSCFATIPINLGFFCPACGRRLPAQVGLPEPKKICHPETKYVLAAASSYQNRPLRELIHAFKYQNARNAAFIFEKLIGFYLKNVVGNWMLEIKNAVVIPIPLHHSKERRRGFNQATLLTETIVKVLHHGVVPELKIETNNLARIKNTVSQTKLENYEERVRNVTGAFQIKFPEKINGKNIILVDDVFTSGATLNEAAGVLKDAGAGKIIAFVIAKA